jgi:hypothetical protein
MAVSNERRSEIVSATKNEWDRQMLLMVEPLFTPSKIKWQFLKKRVVFSGCCANQAIVGIIAVNEIIERIELIFDESRNWHAKIFKSKQDKANPIRMFFHASWGVEL